MDGKQCHAHYRLAVQSCVHCGRGLCDECAEHATRGRCPECDQREHGWAFNAAVQRDARVALRRSGVNVPRQHGDPIVLRANGHPLAAGLLLGLAIITAVAIGGVAAVAEVRWGVPRAWVAPLLGIVTGTCVTAIFGGTSRVAGVVGLLLSALALASAPEVLATVSDGATLPGPGSAAAWMGAHRAVELVCFATALPLAYLSGAGRRVW